VVLPAVAGVAAHPEREICVVLGNLNIHKPKHDCWLARHRNVHFHFTPTHASWLNQVEVWFSILARRALTGASFTSPREVRAAIDRFVAAYNPNAIPFEWTKREVRLSRPLLTSTSTRRAGSSPSGCRRAE
jgi:hypothetical protein